MSADVSTADCSSSGIRWAALDCQIFVVPGLGHVVKAIEAVCSFDTVVDVVAAGSVEERPVAAARVYLGCSDVSGDYRLLEGAPRCRVLASDGEF